MLVGSVLAGCCSVPKAQGSQSSWAEPSTNDTSPPPRSTTTSPAMLRAVPEVDESSIGDDMGSGDEGSLPLPPPSPHAPGYPPTTASLSPTSSSSAAATASSLTSPAALLGLAFQHGGVIPGALVPGSGGGGSSSSTGAGAGAGAGGAGAHPFLDGSLPPGTAAAVSRLWSNAAPGEYMDPGQMIVRCRAQCFCGSRWRDAAACLLLTSCAP